MLISASYVRNSALRFRVFSGVITLIRPWSVLGIMLGGLASLQLTANAWSLEKELAFILGLAFITMGGFADNDACDYRIDKINRPNRPLSTGALHQHTAKLIAFGSFLGGVSALTFVSTSCMLGGLSTVILLLVYSRAVKQRSGLLGNGLIAVLSALPVWLAMWYAHDMRPLPFATLIFGIVFSREILKDLEDRVGDSLNGRRTIALRGKTTTVMLCVMSGIALGLLAGSHSLLLHEGLLTFVRRILDLTLVVGTVGWLLAAVSDTQLKHLLKYGLFGYCLLIVLSGV